MIIVCTCPECNEDLVSLVLPTDPPQYKYECPKCGWFHVESSIEEVVRVPYHPALSPAIHKNSYIRQNIDTDWMFQSEPCRNCSQNPKNGGSGICHCTLGNHITF